MFTNDTFEVFLGSILSAVKESFEIDLVNPQIVLKMHETGDWVVTVLDADFSVRVFRWCYPIATERIIKGPQASEETEGQFEDRFVTEFCAAIEDGLSIACIDPET